MLVGGAPVAATPVAVDDYGVFGTLSPFYEIFERGALEEIVLLFKATVYDPELPGTVEFKAIWSNQDEPWIGKLGDSEAHTNVLLQPASFRSSLFTSLFNHRNPTRGSNVSVGNIRVALAESEQTKFSRYYWDGRPFDIRLGKIDWGYSEFEIITTGTIRDISYSETDLVIRVSDPDEELRKDIQENLYDGLGGLGGTEDLKDHKIPVSYGRSFNVRPHLVDPVMGIYQLHDRQMEEIIVYDGGVHYNQDGPTLDTTDLYAWVPSSGEREYATDLSKGLFRISDPIAQFEITCDIKGDADPALGGYVETLPEVTKRILLHRTNTTEDQIDGLLALASDQNSMVGIYIENGAGTVKNALDELLSPLLVYYFYTTVGDIKLGQFKLGGVNKTLTEVNIVSAKRDSGIGKISSLRMMYKKSGVVQNEVALALEEIDPDRKIQVAEEYRELATDGVSPNHLSAESFEIKTLLYQETEAQLESDRQVQLSDDLKDQLTIVVNTGIFSLEPGQTVRITYAPLNINGRRFTILSKSSNVNDNTNTLVLVGNNG